MKPNSLNYSFTSAPILYWVLLFLVGQLGSSPAQTASIPNNQPEPGNVEAIELPQFTVVNDRDEGWTASSSMSGTRTNVPIRNLPRSVQVLTSEFLDDIGADTMSDAAAFMTGVTSQGKQDAVFDNNTLTLRGMRQNRHYRDGVKEGFVGMINDNASIDRIEILRGPSSLLAGVSEPGGMLNIISKRPRSKNESRLKLSIGSWEYFRTELDVSRNPTNRLAIRAVGAYQTNNTWRDFEGAERKTGYLAVVYKFRPGTVANVRAETIDSEVTLAPASLNLRVPTTSSPTSPTAAPTKGQYGFGFVPSEIVPWDFNPYGPNNSRDQKVHRVSGDLQHQFSDTLSLRLFTSWSLSDRRDLRLSGNASTIIARFIKPSLGNVPGNLVGDEIRWAATKDDEKWDIWTYQVDLRGVFDYWGLRHEAILGVERIESRNWRDRTDTPNSQSRDLGAAPSSDPNALTRYKFPTSSFGAIPRGGIQAAWTEITDLRRYSSPNSYIDQSVVRDAFSFTNVMSTKSERWHALLGARWDRGKNAALSGKSISTIAPQAFPKENATSETVGLLYRLWPGISAYASYSNSFAGVPAGIDVHGDLLTKPESGSSREVGVKASFLDGMLTFETALFELDRTNSRRQLTGVEIESILGYVPSGARYVQDNGEESKGVEFQVLCQPFKAYQIAANFSYIETNLVAPDKPLSDGGPIPGRPRANGSLFHKYAIQSGPLKGFFLNNGVIWVDGARPDIVTDGVVTNYLPSYVRIDVGVGCQFRVLDRTWTIAANVRNLGNKKYWEGLQSKGDLRNYRLSISGHF